MTQAELTFYELVPRALRDIANELKTLNGKNEKASKPETPKAPAMENTLKPYWDEERNGVFVPLINKVIDAHNLCEEEKNWDEAMRLAKEAGKALPSVKEMHLMFYFKDEINALLEEHGGDKLEGWFWASTEYNSTNAWIMAFSNGDCTYDYKFISTCVRAVAAI